MISASHNCSINLNQLNYKQTIHCVLYQKGHSHNLLFYFNQVPDNSDNEQQTS